MKLKIAQRILISILILLALSCLIMTKYTEGNIFHILYLILSILVIFMVVGQGMGFDTFKNSKISRGIRISLIIDFIFISVSLLMLLLGNYLCTITLVILSGFSIIYNLYNVRKSINSK